MPSKRTAKSSGVGQPAASKPADPTEHSEDPGSGVAQPVVGSNTLHPQVTETGDPVSVGSHHADDSSQHFDFHAFDQPCREVLAKCEMPGFVSEAVEALKAMLPELQQQPSQERVRQMAKFLGEPQKVKGSNLTTDQMFRNVRQKFGTILLGCDASSSGGAHPAAHASSGASGSGGPHPAADVLPALDKRIEILSRLPVSSRGCASSQCQCPHDLDAADMKKLFCEIQHHSWGDSKDGLVALLKHGLSCMSPQKGPLVPAKLQAYAQRQTDLWKWAANRQCKRMPNGDVLCNLRCGLYAAVQTYLAAVAEYDRIQDAPEYERELNRAHDVAERMLMEAGLLPSSGGAHPAAHASSGASGSGGPHPAADILPDLDTSILEAVHEFGRYPKELNTISGKEDKEEQKLARNIRDQWVALLPATRARLLQLQAEQNQEEENTEYPHLAEINKMILKICPRVPEHMITAATYVLHKLHLMKKIRSKEFLKKEVGVGTQWWKEAGVRQTTTIPKGLQSQVRNARAQTPAVITQYNLSFVAYQEAAKFLDKLQAYYESDGVDARAWRDYHMHWKTQVDAGSFSWPSPMQLDEFTPCLAAHVKALLSGYPGPQTKHFLVTYEGHAGLLLLDPAWPSLGPGAVTQFELI